ncbi:hypothetical protein SLEP1_g46986 [Rubroshorea leprosula]|uniref:Uncharacterized protein n=1 Tax=Rubroshorea leprosula TaxID=152421 RepID=A0AAV5LPS5_9ROSI|nr:hypothetical protein SLEP1_g46986 [Rubroshorea leprosula]
MPATACLSILFTYNTDFFQPSNQVMDRAYRASGFPLVIKPGWQAL